MPRWLVENGKRERHGANQSNCSNCFAAINITKGMAKHMILPTAAILRISFIILQQKYIYLGLPCWLGFHSALYLTSHCHKCIVNIVCIFRRCFEEFNSKAVSKFFSFLWACKLSSTKLIALSGVDQCGWWCVYYECIRE